MKKRINLYFKENVIHIHKGRLSNYLQNEPRFHLTVDRLDERMKLEVGTKLVLHNVDEGD